MKEDTGTFFRRAYRAGARVLSIAQLLFAGAASKRYGGGKEWTFGDDKGYVVPYVAEMAWLEPIRECKDSD
ncbi:hypothetical protein TNCV_4818981 [Trichonephila clavipes]|nr:hypothetical protein TNCV_4818981 [Trichonephila clavipes]